MQNGTTAGKPSEVIFDAASGHLYAEAEAESPPGSKNFVKVAIKGTTKGQLKVEGYRRNPRAGHHPRQNRSCSCGERTLPRARLSGRYVTCRFLSLPSSPAAGRGRGRRGIIPWRASGRRASSSSRIFSSAITARPAKPSRQRPAPAWKGSLVVASALCNTSIWCLALSLANGSIESFRIFRSRETPPFSAASLTLNTNTAAGTLKAGFGRPGLFGGGLAGPGVGERAPAFAGARNVDRGTGPSPLASRARSRGRDPEIEILSRAAP